MAAFVATAAVSGTATGDLVNTATVAAPASVRDPITSNSTATDVDQAAPLLTIRNISVGGVASCGFTGTNGVVPQTLLTEATGTPVSGATQSPTAAATATTITESIAPMTYQCTITASGRP